MEFNRIGEIIVPLLPEKWESLRMFCQIDDSSYEFFFFVKVNGQFIQNFDLEKKFNITRKEMRLAFKELYISMKDSQKIEQWKIATILLESTGDFKIQFDYDTPLETINNEYKNRWKQLYLK